MNPGRVVHETIDGEAILIDLESGLYFSLVGSGAEIWGMLARGYSVADTSVALSVRYSAADGEIQASVARLAAELVEEELLEPGEPPAPIDGMPAHSSERLPFDEPKLEKFTDMQDFLLVDPIHEVDASGWPNTKPS
jgi:hypothetical protein